MNKFLLQTNKKFLSIVQKGTNIKSPLNSFRNIYLASKNTNTNPIMLYNNRNKRITLIPKNKINHYRSFSTKNDTDKPTFVDYYIAIGICHAILFAILACVLLLADIFSLYNKPLSFFNPPVLIFMSCVWPLIWIFAIISIYKQIND